MLLRRRCGVTDALSAFFLSACALILLLVCSIIYGTRTENRSLPPLVQEVLPAGRCLCEFSTTFSCDTCLECAASQTSLPGVNATTDEDEAWVFNYRRDANNYGLDEDQCQAAFPGLYEDIERARKFRGRHNKVTEQELSSFRLSKGMVRAMIYDGEVSSCPNHVTLSILELGLIYMQLYILQTFMVDNINRQKAVGTLAAIHRAIVSTPHRDAIPNIEFVLSVEDLPAQSQKPVWGLARRAQDHDLWLIPDFGFWAWDMPQIGTFSEVASEAIEREAIEPWDQKQEKLVWRGKINYAPKLRRALLEAARGKPWSDVGQLQWSGVDFKEQFLGPVDQCNYMFIAHAEGRSYSGALKYRQLCRSVIVSHKLQWIQHYHYLFRSEGPNQNFVEVERDFSDLDYAMADLLAHPEKAKRIADNSVKVFRERYLTAAAEACYWRQLFKAWKEVSFEPILYNGVEVGEKHKRTQKRGVRYEHFILYETERQMEYPKTA
ncbi:glycosyl transferase family 90-domain-containing protein [Lophiotrema nucula]|uniref:Glycosyl transferase family 90-domain-containing protein n=1 Tax=Lophiotrema nucula TaxID=690887 RepID=A0A6A5YSK3_9PLEO|nr:glycosyl transferase family 90-domain-containing protein [Lophiotrema nucula]